MGITIYIFILILLAAGVLLITHFGPAFVRIEKSGLSFFSQKDTESLLPASQVEMINKASSLYPLLNNKLKRRFERRLATFMTRKNFVASEGIDTITEEMKVIISAIFTQLTFGHPAQYLDMFKTVILRADDYYSSRTGQYYEGEVNLIGCIVLSWKNLMADLENESDGHNLGLHEAAHALRLSYAFFEERESDEMTKLIHEFDELAVQEMNNYETGNQTFFREYGAENYNEFFAVAIECYFEKPRQLFEYNPLIYNKLKQILKLDLLDPEHIIAKE
ncbi:MAG TPA: zinc-dependent peptidase [Bacteroidales bacterium]|nr:zinc-dependent peptidase [Bacteroidales bacterium]HPT03498.1 zinc-dependent peptidase [Bacteroidales bacterium]